jgi:SAM-dependent methyltransferase
LRQAPHIAPNRHTAHPFDLKYGTDTAGYLSPEQLRDNQTNDAMNNGYSAVAPSVFRQAFLGWRATLSESTRVEAYTFIDVGAGKGRALLLAAESPFRKVIGVELNKELSLVAEKNIAQWKRIANPRAKVRVIQQDALRFRWPGSPVLIYLNNPFDCALIEQLAVRIAAAAKAGSGLADLIYVNPGCADTLTRQGLFRLLWNEQFEMDENDRRADPYGATSDRVCAFRRRA